MSNSSNVKIVELMEDMLRVLIESDTCSGGNWGEDQHLHSTLEIDALSKMHDIRERLAVLKKELIEEVNGESDRG